MFLIEYPLKNLAKYQQRVIFYIYERYAIADFIILLLNKIQLLKLIQLLFLD